MDAKWISVGDYLPQRMKVVLVYDNRLWCRRAESMWAEGSANCGYWDGNCWTAGGFAARVTHWMPLPNPPRKGGRNHGR
jgi:hypothetical protein